MKILGRDCGCESRKARLKLAWRIFRGVIVPLQFQEGAGLYIEGILERRLFRADGRVELLPVLHNTITDAAADALANDFFDASKDVTAFDFHAWGTGACVIPPACTVTALVTEASEVRVAGTASKPAVRQYRTVGTITAAAAKTITEWGLADAATLGTFWSIRCFTGVALASGDAIEFTYTLSVSCVTG